MMGLEEERMKSGNELCAGILEHSIGATNRVGIWLSYRPVRIHAYAGGIDLLELTPEGVFTELLFPA